MDDQNRPQDTNNQDMKINDDGTLVGGVSNEVAPANVSQEIDYQIASINELTPPPNPVTSTGSNDIALPKDNSVEENQAQSRTINVVDAPNMTAPSINQLNSNETVASSIAVEPHEDFSTNSDFDQPIATESTFKFDSPLDTQEQDIDHVVEQAPAQSPAPITQTQNPGNLFQPTVSNNSKLIHEHRNNKKFAVIITVVTALLLSGVAYYVFLSTEDNTAPVQTVIESNEEPAPALEPATVEDIDQAIEDVDAIVEELDNPENAEDLNEEALTDETLEL